MIILLSCSCLITLCFRSVKVYIEDMNAVTTMSVPGRVDWKFDDKSFQNITIITCEGAPVPTHLYLGIDLWTSYWD